MSPNIPPSERKNVLVIDDSDTARMAMCGVLVAAGFTVLDLPSAIGATRAILRNAIVAVVVDISMPGLSGDRLVGVLRKSPALTSLKIVVVSSDETLLARAQVLEGVDATLLKSGIDLHLPRIVRRLLAEPRLALSTH